MSLESMFEPNAPPSTDEEDLRWYFRTRSNATGPPPSNFEAMLRRVWGGLAGRDSARPDDQLLDAGRCKQVEAALHACGPRLRSVLENCLGDQLAPELEVYGMLAGLVVRMPEAIAAHRVSGSEEDLASWLGRLPRRAREAPAMRILLEDLLRSGQRDLLRALLAYRDAKRRLGQRRR